MTLCALCPLWQKKMNHESTHINTKFKTRIVTVDIRHGFTQINSVQNLFLCAFCAL